MMFSIFTMSYNKYQYVAETIRSVLSQTFTDFEYWIIENSTDNITPQVTFASTIDKRVIYIRRDYSHVENKRLIPAMILNEYIPQAHGKYILTISDDDLFNPNLLEIIVHFMQNEPFDCAYFEAEVQSLENGVFKKISTMPVTGVRTPGMLDCSIDGNQTVYSTELVKGLEKPCFNEGAWESTHIDGIFMERLAALAPFHPIRTAEPMYIKRRTPVSTFTNNLVK